MMIHFWDLPSRRTYIILNEKFKGYILKILKDKKYPWKIRNRFENRKTSIKKIKEICMKENIPLDIIEKNISWIGGNNSKGLSNPKFPIKFSSRAGARFIAGIVNDGCLTKSEKRNCHGRLMYDNFDKDLRNSMMEDYLIIFGGKSEEISFRDYERKKFLEFSSVIRDILELILIDKGPKCETNLKIPEFIFKDKECMIGWIEQTIGDEGDVKHYPNKYRRSIIWSRALDVSNIFSGKIKENVPFRRLPLKFQKLIQTQKCNLIEGEKRILDSLGIYYNMYNEGVYLTSKNKIRTKFQINLTKRKNLIKLRKLIKIPCKVKNKRFTESLKYYVRYKEPLNIQTKIINICKKKGKITSNDLQKAMNYRRTNNAYKWLKKFEDEGLIRMIRKSQYGGGKYRVSAEYALL